jgi:hypothetical protein
MLTGAAFLVVAAPLVGCGNLESGAPLPIGLEAEQLSAFADECQESLQGVTRRPGQLDYPATMTVSLGKAAVYNAAIDVRDAPAPPEKMIDAEDPAAESVLVKCGVSAKLAAVDGGIEVAASTDETSVDGWYYRSFGPTGVVEWSWAVTARTPDDHTLQLTVRPSLSVSGQVAYSGQTDVTTKVTTTATWIEKLANWFDTQFSLLKAIGVALGAAIIGFLVFSQQVRDRIRGLFSKDKPADTTNK